MLNLLYLWFQAHRKSVIISTDFRGCRRNDKRLTWELLASHPASDMFVLTKFWWLCVIMTTSYFVSECDSLHLWHVRASDCACVCQRDRASVHYVWERAVCEEIYLFFPNLSAFQKRGEFTKCVPPGSGGLPSHKGWCNWAGYPERAPLVGGGGRQTQGTEEEVSGQHWKENVRKYTVCKMSSS